MTQSEGQASSDRRMKKYLWEYPLVWIGVVALLVAVKYLLPHFPLGKGWESKFGNAAIDLGKQSPPDSAKPVTSLNEVVDFLNALEIPMITDEPLRFDEATVQHVWKCRLANKDSACVRMVWKNEPLTLAVTKTPGKVKKQKAPFVSKGWGGSFIYRDKIAWVVVGPFEPQEITEAWPFARNFNPGPALNKGEPGITPAQ